MQATDIVIANMINNPELQPEASKKIFAKMQETATSLMQIEKSIEEVRTSLNKMHDDRISLVASVNSFASAIETLLSPEDIEKYGKEIIKNDSSKKV